MQCSSPFLDPVPVLGIDLGTRFTCAYVWWNHCAHPITDNLGNRQIPTVVAFQGGRRFVGQEALSLKDTSPGTIIYDIKRILGKKYDDPIIGQISRMITYGLREDSQDHQILVCPDGEHTYRPEEIVAYLFREIYRLATARWKNLYKAVFTVPVHFDDGQRRAILNAARIAGLEVLRLVNEPTAACIAYGIGSNGPKERTVLVYDFGAGTLDVSLINVHDGIFETLAIGGNICLGGEDIDRLIMDYVLQELHVPSSVLQDKNVLVKFKSSAELAKKLLSSLENALVHLELPHDRLGYLLTRTQFEKICHGLFSRALQPVEDVLAAAGVARDQVDEIVLVGGSTRIPAVQKMLLDYFQGGRVEHLNTQVDPDGAVALGAAIYGYTLVHPDDPFSQSIMLLDITPISLGVEVLQSQMSIIIPRNTIIPTKCTCMYTTDTDHQDSVIIRIFEGEHQLTCHNRLVATLELSGFQKAPKGHALIAITFQIDANRMLHVMAQERCSGVYRDITLVNLWDSDRLNPEKIEKMAQRICAEDYISRTQLERTRPAGTSDQARELFWELAEETQKILKSFDAHEYPRIPMHQFRKELDLHYLWYHSHPNAKTTEYLDHTRSLQKLSENLLAHTEKKISDKNSILLKLDFEKLNSDFHYKYKFHSNRQES